MMWMHLICSVMGISALAAYADRTTTIITYSALFFGFVITKYFSGSLPVYLELISADANIVTKFIYYCLLTPLATVTIFLVVMMGPLPVNKY